jgi:hypothetical protein
MNQVRFQLTTKYLFSIQAVRKDKKMEKEARKGQSLKKPQKFIFIKIFAKKVFQKV